MVDLALLCNLYADGPTTLGRLRELGCESLADVERIERADLEWALQASSQSCERFRREARALRERTANLQAAPQKSVPQKEAPLRPTEAAPRDGRVRETTADSRGVDASSSARLMSEHSASAALKSEPHELSAMGLSAKGLSNAVPSTEDASHTGDELTSGTARPAPSTSILGVLLQAWRRASGRGGDAPARPRHESNDRRLPARREAHRAPFFDERESATNVPAFDLRSTSSGSTSAELHAAHREGAAPAPSATPATPPGSAAPSSAARSDHPTVELTPVEPKPSVRSSPAPTGERRPEHGTPLERIGFQGVEADYAEQLARLGVRTVEDFLATQPLDLAGRSSMRYTVLLRMQFLARRELERVVRG